MKKLSLLSASTVALLAAACMNGEKPADKIAASNAKDNKSAVTNILLTKSGKSQSADRSGLVASTGGTTASSTTSSSGTDYASRDARLGPPPSARPGECFAKVFVPAVYKTVAEKIVDRPATERIETTPAKYGDTVKKIRVDDGGEKVHVIPATYKTVTERVMVRAPRFKTVVRKPVIKVTKRRVLLSAARDVWVPVGKNGNTIRRQRIPAKYQTVVDREVVRPGTTERVEVTPAKYKTIKRRVIDRPARIIREKVPAKYKLVKVRKLLEPSRTNKIPVPAVYKNVSKRVIASPGRQAWRPMLCKKDRTWTMVRKVQKALRRNGDYTGRLNGRLTVRTLRALDRFQAKRKIPRGYLTFETLRELGIRGPYKRG
jgi:hypothetical protein